MNASGKYHREDGPAIIHANGKEYFFWHGRQYPSLQDFPQGPLWISKIMSRMENKEGRLFFIETLEGVDYWVYHDDNPDDCEIIWISKDTQKTLWIFRYREGSSLDGITEGYATTTFEYFLKNKFLIKSGSTGEYFFDSTMLPKYPTHGFHAKKVE